MHFDIEAKAKWVVVMMIIDLALFVFNIFRVF